MILYKYTNIITIIDIIINSMFLEKNKIIYDITNQLLALILHVLILYTQ